MLYRPGELYRGLATPDVETNFAKRCYVGCHIRCL
jgi:hypothetical protein